MELSNRLIQVRVQSEATTKQKILSIVAAIAIGVILGITASLWILQM